MVQYCCVPGCKERTGGHKFPRDAERKKKWLIAIKRIDPTTKRLWNPSHLDVVCRKHFRQHDFRQTLLGERQRLTDDAVPSLFEFRATETETARSKRQEVRNAARNVWDSVPEVACEVEIHTEVEIDPRDGDPPECPQYAETSSQCEILNDRGMRLNTFRSNNTAIKYYTGFNDFEHVMFFFACLGEAATNLNFRCDLLEPVDQMFLTLIKLRQAKENLELSIMFKISPTTVSRVFNTWLNFIYFQLKEINIWPSKIIVQSNMPESFKTRFPTTRVILDATETPIQKPSNTDAQSCTFSTYKNKNTLKTMIGCTPRGLVSYISLSFGGSASDRQIIERSGLMHPGMFSPRDSIMADRGIMVQDLFASRDVYVNTPTMLRGKSQLEAEEVVRDRRVASKRIHVERVIGLSKTYKILKNDLHQSKLNQGSRIVFVCFMLSNFRNSIVNRLA